MGRIDYLAMKTDQETAELLNSDFNELKMAAKKLIDHATKLGGLGFGTSLLKWVASFAAMSAFYLTLLTILVKSILIDLLDDILVDFDNLGSSDVIMIVGLMRITEF